LVFGKFAAEGVQQHCFRWNFPGRRIEKSLESLGYGRGPIADRREVEGKI
jgi:hypothetical protein